jgi:hypothetical protein
MKHVFEKKDYPETFNRADADTWLKKIRAEVQAKGWKIIKEEQWEGPSTAVYTTLEADDAMDERALDKMVEADAFPQK